MDNSKLLTINQMILATIFALGLLAIIFAVLFMPTAPSTQALTIVGTLITQLGTVVIMQNTHFFKTPDQSGTTGVVTNVNPNPSPAPSGSPSTQP